jgi:hypothetical protein
MFPDDIKNHPSVKAVLAKLPGATIKEVRRHQPGSHAGAPERITWTVLHDFAESERLRAENSLHDCLDEANAADDADRANFLQSAADHRHRAAVFAKIAQQMRRIGSSAFIRDELRIIAEREAAEEAERVFEAKQAAEENKEP